MIATALPTGGQLGIGMTDIAVLAQVQRPVVSKWRQRFAGGPEPFPSPIAVERGRDVFDALAVAGWLRDTGHGNNPLAMEDVAAFATVSDDHVRSDRSTFETLTAALCLRSILGQPLSDRTRVELLDLADPRSG